MTMLSIEIYHMSNMSKNAFQKVFSASLAQSEVDTCCFRHQYIDFGQTNMGVPKFNLT